MPAQKERPYLPGMGYHGGTLAKGCFMAHVDDQRVARVLDALEAQHPGAQLLVNDPWSIYYLTGFYADMFERFCGVLLARGAGPVIDRPVCGQPSEGRGAGPDRSVGAPEMAAATGPAGEVTEVRQECAVGVVVLRPLAGGTTDSGMRMAFAAPPLIQTPGAPLLNQPFREFCFTDFYLC